MSVNPIKNRKGGGAKWISVVNLPQFQKTIKITASFSPIVQFSPTLTTCPFADGTSRNRVERSRYQKKKKNYPKGLEFYDSGKFNEPPGCMDGALRRARFREGRVGGCKGDEF